MNIDTIIQIAGTIAISGITAYGTIAYTLGKYKEKIDKIDEYNPASKIAELDSKLSEKLSDLSDRISKLEGNMEKMPSAYMQSQSPLKLTDKGEELLKDSGGKFYIDEHIDVFIENIKKSKPNTAYDVQEYSRDLIREQQIQKEFNPIKDFAFQEGLHLDLITSVMGLYLRDKAIDKLGFDIDEIDKYEKQKK